MEAGAEERLEDGWQSSTPGDDTLVRAWTLSFADWLIAIGRAGGHRVLDDPAVSALDCGGDHPLANGAVLRGFLAPDELRDCVTRVRDFFAGAAGGPWLLISPLPVGDPTPLGLGLVGHPPVMVRAAGGEAPPDPEGLRVVEVHDETTLADFRAAFVEGFPAPGTEPFFGPSLPAVEGTRLWVGYLGDRPVATSCAHAAPGATHVEFISTVPDARGRGIGAALTWRATLADPSKPAVLASSDPGQPVYTRMGYLRVLRVTMLAGGRDAAS
jgi:hypothetical protein